MVNYHLQRFDRNPVKVIQARREISSEIRLAAKMVLDDICFQGNKARLDEAINQALDQSNEEAFQTLTKEYRYIWEL